MRISLNWINDFVDIKDIDVDELSFRLVNAGFEVESIEFEKDKVKNIKVGKILEINKHENADRLTVCKVDVGYEIQIVTAATNIAVGDCVPVALDGAILADKSEIKRGKLRGVLSEGMFCSYKELGLEIDDYKDAAEDGILILNDQAVIGQEIQEHLGFDDIFLDIEITANRPDCQSIIGIAREISTIFSLPFKMPKMTYKTKNKNIENELKLVVENKTLCPRYMAAIVDDIKIEESPKWMQKRLKGIGLRPINNIVDITNYVLIEMGQPMHAFDFNKIEGQKIVVRTAKNNEKIKLLDDTEITLTDKNLAICDANIPMALAGVMGGADSGISETTDKIVFESARFERASIRHTSRDLNVRSDSSARFEKRIDFLSQENGLNRALALIDELGCGTIYKGQLDSLNKLPKKKIIRLSKNHIKRVLGIDFELELATKILNSLSIESHIEKRSLVAKIPLFREDIFGPNDLVEEIIRIYGYDHLESVLFKRATQTVGGKTQKEKLADTVKSYLVNNGYSETLTLSFSTPKMFDFLQLDKNNKLRDAIVISNPLGQELSTMRTTLAYSMLMSIKHNINNSIKEGRLFELSKVYIANEMPIKKQPKEIRHLAMGSFGQDENFYTLKADLLNVLDLFDIDYRIEYSKQEFMHPYKAIDIYINDEFVGYCGEVHPKVGAKISELQKVYIAEISYDFLEDLYKHQYSFEELSKYPAVERDIAVLVDEDIAVAELLAIVEEGAGRILVSREVFDIYRSEKIGADKKSVAIKMTFRANDRTLSEEEINKKIDRIIKLLEQKVNGVLRK